MRAALLAAAIVIAVLLLLSLVGSGLGSCGPTDIRGLLTVLSMLPAYFVCEKLGIHADSPMENAAFWAISFCFWFPVLWGGIRLGAFAWRKFRS